MTFTADEMARIAVNTYSMHNAIPHLGATLRDAGAEIERVVVSVDKVRMVVFIHNGVAFAAMPTAKCRAFMVLYDDPNGGWTVELSGYRYAYDPLTNTKRFMAMLAAIRQFNMHDITQAVHELGKAAGNCAICGALLTDELSVARGVGPECIKKIGVAHWWRNQK